MRLAAPGVGMAWISNATSSARPVETRNPAPPKSSEARMPSPAAEDHTQASPSASTFVVPMATQYSVLPVSSNV
jgi:hypothetical protein